MWMGGTPPLGYDVRERKLVVNESEAVLVRSIFARYAETRSAAQLVRELQIEGHTTKAWVTQNGRQREGSVIDQQVLFAMLRNRLYPCEMTHKGQSFTGQHEAIVTPELWAGWTSSGAMTAGRSSAGSWRGTHSWSSSGRALTRSASGPKWRWLDRHANRTTPSVRDDGTLSDVRATGDQTPT